MRADSAALASGASLDVITHHARRLARTVHTLVIVYLLLGVFGGVFLLAGAAALLSIAVVILLAVAGMAATYGMTAPLQLTPVVYRLPAALVTAGLVAVLALSVVAVGAFAWHLDLDTVVLAAAIAGALFPLALVAVAALLVSTKLPTTRDIARSSLWGLGAASLTASVALIAPRLYVHSLLWLGLPFLGFVFFIFGAVRLVTALERLRGDVERRELGARFE